MTQETVSDRRRGTGGGELPLTGIRVLELGRDSLPRRLLANCWAIWGLRLSRSSGPVRVTSFGRYGFAFVKDSDGNPTAESAPYMSTNRNKRSVAVDLAHPEGAAVVRDLARKCDVFIENFKVGALAKFGLDDAALRAVNPAMIYLSVSGFGQTGPYAPRPATDSAFQAMSGIWDVTGEPNGEPAKIGTPASDSIGGLYGALAVLAALRHRDRTGEGQRIDLSLLDCSIAFLAPRSSEYLITSKVPGRIGNRTPGTAPGQLFRCADGAIMVQAGSNSALRHALQDPRSSRSRR